MDGLSVLYALSPAFDAELYKQGNAHGWLAKSAAAVASHYLAGRLYMAKSGWLLLAVPNALVRGVFDAMTDAGVELPLAGVLNVPNVDKELLNAHISVMTAEEAAKIGAGNINERGQSFKYSLGPVKELAPKNIDGVSRLWAIQVSSPELSALRKSYGLSALPKDEPFHITVAVRRTGVLRENTVSKGYEMSAQTSNEPTFRNPTSRGSLKAAADNETTYDCNCAGRCTCPDTCVCKKSCCAGSGKTAADMPQPRVRIVLPYKGKYLLETLNNPKWPQNLGKRRFIGGGIEGAETPEQTAAREMFEELGVKIKPTAFRALGTDPNNPHEHYLELAKHKLKPGNFKATVGSDPIITLAHGVPAGDDYIGPDIKKLLAPVLKKAAEKLPWRERAEVYARDPITGKLYGGKWDNDGSFALPGGGIDPGEDPATAALRELEEETGIKATNARVLPVAPVDFPWTAKMRAEKAKQGRGNFAGSRTHFIAADIVNHAQGKKLDFWAAKDRGYYDPTEALAIMQSVKKYNAPTIATARIAALNHLIANAAKKTASELSRSGQKDLLPGGKADNVPDQEFSPKELAIGAADEHEHTNNDQVAREIAKDHLQEDPQYYKKEKLNQKEAQPAIILKLREAKEHSDNKRYDKKNEILRRLMTQAPDEWFVDDPLPRHMGITHAPTSFRFHADPVIIPTGVKVKAKAASSNPYWDQITNFSQAPVIDKSKSVWQNFFNHLKNRTANADRQYDMQQNDHKWRAELIPGYREQMNTAIARGEFPKPNPTAEFLRNTATPALAAVT
jgi:8-oxo-dGTP pyrophosphatase MutT (NUDIX family)